MRLLYTGGGVERWVDHAEERMRAFHLDSGYAYLKHVPSTPADILVVEDLGVTLLMNSQVTWKNAISVAERGSEIDLALLADGPLEETDERARQLVASVASWRGFGASTATKLMHKKRPGLIPILDNLAIFGGYMNPN
jgi:hypothetical protein